MPTLGTLLQRASARVPRSTCSPLFRRDAATRARNRRFQSTDSKRGARRIAGILAGASRFMPMRLRGALQDLRSAPLSHVVAFLVLHEITAVLPIFGLTYAFYTLDVDVPAADWVVAEDGLNRWTNYFRKKRWFGLEPEDDEEPVSGTESLELTDEKTRAGAGELVRATREGTARNGLERERKLDASATAHDSTLTSSSEEAVVDWRSWVMARMWKANPPLDEAASSQTKVRDLEQEDDAEGRPKNSKSTKITPPESPRILETQKNEAARMASEKLQKIVIQVAAAYAITKMLLVPRIALSLWLTPWLARGFVGFRRALRRKKKVE